MSMPSLLDMKVEDGLSVLRKSQVGGDDQCGPARLFSEQAYWSMNAMMLKDLLIAVVVESMCDVRKM